MELVRRPERLSEMDLDRGKADGVAGEARPAGGLKEAEAVGEPGASESCRRCRAGGRRLWRGGVPLSICKARTGERVSKVGVDGRSRREVNKMSDASVPTLP